MKPLACLVVCAALTLMAGCGLDDSMTDLDFAGTPTIPDDVEGPSSLGITIESFSVVEFFWPDPPVGATHWYYAPLLAVRAQSGAGVQVSAVQVDVPAISDIYCTAHRAIEPGGSVELFRVIYGDYELSVDHGSVRADPRMASASVFFVDANGNSGIVSALGPIVSGPAFPETESALGTVTDEWQCKPTSLLR